MAGAEFWKFIYFGNSAAGHLKMALNQIVVVTLYKIFSSKNVGVIMLNFILQILWCKCPKNVWSGILEFHLFWKFWSFEDGQVLRYVALV